MTIFRTLKLTAFCGIRRYFMMPLIGGNLAFAITLALSSEVWAMSQSVDGGRVRDSLKIGDSLGGFTGMISNGEYLGAVTAIGDVDGDGVEDLAVGASGDNDGGFNRGAVWILFLGVDGTVRSFQKISQSSGGFSGLLDDRDGFGTSVTPLGDLDGDCVTELAVGVPGDDDGAFGIGEVGAVWILFLSASGRVKSSQKISATQGGFGGMLDDLDCFGCSVAGLGDLDGDGVEDLGVGAIRDDDGGMDRGAVWILFLNADGTVKAHQKISATQGGFSGPLPDGGQFGACARLDDLDSDGVGELAVGATDVDPYYGAVWILFLNRDGTVRTQVKIGQGSGGFSGMLRPEDFFAIPCSLGDIDDDGIGDMAVGAFGDDDGGTGMLSDRGAVWILTLHADGTVKSNQKISDSRGGFGGILTDGDYFGSYVSSVGDLDGDGSNDLAVGALGDDGNGVDRGAVWILFLGQGKERLNPDAPRPGGSRSLPLTGSSGRRLCLVPEGGSASPGAIPILVLAEGLELGAVSRSRFAGLLARSPGFHVTLQGPPLSGAFSSFELPRDPRLAGITFSCEGLFLDPGFGVRPRAVPAFVTIDCRNGRPLTHITLSGVDVR